MTLSPSPNLQLVYVSDIGRSTAFYSKLFAAKPVFESPRYVAFSAGGQGALFAIWTGGAEPNLETPRFHEIGIMLPTNDDVDQLYSQWKGDSDIKVIQEPRDEVFGRTFLIQDPDGHVIRVCPID